VDTRSKILTLPQAMAITARPVAIVSGTFDVLRAEHAHELQKVHERAENAVVLVVVLPRERELLTQHARAELVAALRSVDFVVVATPAELQTLAEALRPECVADLRDLDEQLSLDLRRRVRGTRD